MADEILKCPKCCYANPVMTAKCGKCGRNLEKEFNEWVASRVNKKKRAIIGIIKIHEFEVMGGGVTANGKTNWPDCLNIKMSRKIALDLISTLANSLRHDDSDVLISYCGKLSYDIEE